MSVKILNVDGHELFCEGVSHILSGQDDFEVIPYATTSNECIERLTMFKVNLVVIGVSIGNNNGLKTVAAVNQDFPNVKILALSGYENVSVIKKVIGAGAKGHVLKRSSSSDLLEGIRLVLKGSRYMCPETQNCLLNGYQSKEIHDDSIKLTQKEEVILTLICEGLSTTEIANKLGNAFNTIETHRKKLMRKTGCRNMIGLMRFAIENGIIRFNTSQSQSA